MEKVTPQWLRQRLDTTGTTQRAIAEILGIRPEQVTRILQSKRRIQDKEADILREQFKDVNEPTTLPPALPVRAFFGRAENGGATMTFQTDDPENDIVSVFIDRRTFETFKLFIAEL